jgi:hypothetical protein
LNVTAEDRQDSVAERAGHTSCPGLTIASW